MKASSFSLLISFLVTLFGSPSESALAIDSLFPSCGPVGISVSCQLGRGSFSAFPGSYDLNLTIGTRTFRDQLEIQYITENPGMLNMSEVVSGIFSSSEAGLYSPIINGKIALQKKPEKYEMTFEIRVTEAGVTYPVFFLMTGPDACRSEGSAYLDRDRTKLMGTFVMTKQGTDCKCGGI